MPAYFRVNIDGGYSGNPETWSTSFATTSDPSAPVATDLVAWADAIMGQLAGSALAGASTLRSLLSSNGQIRRVRIYWYPSTSSPAFVSGESTAAVIAGTSTVEQVPQVATVFSLITGIPGGSYRGRMYWPAVGASTNTAGKLTLPSQSNTTNVAALLEALAQLYPGASSTQLAVVSQAKDVVTEVTAIRWGDVADTQRRRRDALVETYFTAAL